MLHQQASSRPLALVKKSFGVVQNGISLVTYGGLLLQFSPWAVIVLAVALVPAAYPKKKPRPSQALIAGTVFQSSGRSLPGAAVEVRNESNRKKKFGARTDRRGEFAIRVPAGKATFQVTAKAKGFGPEQKSVEVYADEKVTLNFILSPK